MELGDGWKRQSKRRVIF